MSASRLSINEAGPGTLHAVGVIDAHTASSLESALGGRGTDQDITLDLSDIEFIDSSGLRVIVTSHQQLEAVGRRLVLRGPSEAVQRLFELTGLEGHLHLS